MAVVMAIIINNFQLNYRNKWAGRNLWGRSFSFTAWNLPIMVQQKLIFQIFKKFNMAAIRGDNVLLKYWKHGLFGIYEQDRFHFHCACYRYLDNTNSNFKFSSNWIWQPLQVIIIDNFHLEYQNMFFHPQE